MKKIFLILSLLFSFSYANIEEYFPKLTSRVIDEVGLLNQSQKANLENILKQEEDSSSNQIVVVILKSLHNYDIADFSYQLGRYWGIGQKDKNNGVLLVVSVDDKKLRIEVGYGLEGALTDKISHEIINYTLKPYFRQKQFSQGINKAVNEIQSAIKGEYENKTTSSDELDISQTTPLLFFLVLMFSMFSLGRSSQSKNLLGYKIAKSSMFSTFFSLFTYMATLDMTKYGLILSAIVFILVFIFNFLTTKKIPKRLNKSSNLNHDGYSSGYGGGFGGFGGGFSGGGGFGGFSGGGGSFGGGGASGGW